MKPAATMTSQIGTMQAMGQAAIWSTTAIWGAHSTRTFTTIWGTKAVGEPSGTRMPSVDRSSAQPCEKR